MIGRTLGLYLAARFTRAILAVFGTIFLLVYLIDFVEMLRRAGDISNVTSLGLAFLTLLRVPAITEQILPFATLGGAMFAFISLTRRLELVVARAAAGPWGAPALLSGSQSATYPVFAMSAAGDLLAAWLAQHP